MDSDITHEQHKRFSTIENAVVRILDHLGLEHGEGSVSEPAPEPEPTAPQPVTPDEVATLREQLAAANARLSEHDAATVPTEPEHEQEVM